MSSLLGKTRAGLRGAILTGAEPASDTPPALQIYHETLPNGLNVVLAEERSRPVTNLQVWYHVGSKDEQTGRTGFAHLFEHLMFRGSKNVAPEQHMRLVRQAGGQVNAYTTFDQTVYWETFPSNYLERMLWLEADRMASLDISQENFTKEREVVKEERRMRFENQPYGLVSEAVLAETYQIYPYKHLPIGSVEDLERATLADVQAFHSTFYVPNNATLVLVGDFDLSEALQLARTHFAALPRGRDVPRVQVEEPAHTAPAGGTVKLVNIPLPAVTLSWILPPMRHPDTYALDVAGIILSSGQSSRIYRRLVYEEQLAQFAFGQAQTLEGPSFFFGAAVVNQGKDIEKLSAGLLSVIHELGQTAPASDELVKAKNQLIAGFITGREGVQSKADSLGRCAVLLADPARYNTELERYRQVTAEDVRRVTAHYLAAGNMTRLVFPASAPLSGPAGEEPSNECAGTDDRSDIQ
jgi:zinc protease